MTQTPHQISERVSQKTVNEWLLNGKDEGGIRLLLVLVVLGQESMVESVGLGAVRFGEEVLWRGTSIFLEFWWIQFLRLCGICGGESWFLHGDRSRFLRQDVWGYNDLVGKWSLFWKGLCNHSVRLLYSVLYRI
eukprot:Protomagalhaensia_wolfi_Nauph_80__577@NODE_1326_length_1587_cov_143_695090_g1024_i1_p2_GENE_NODE_1326_length_1587_cov_143_695090_g1024_i1NODE_1326_length_1587_cov_143_695090_g1024_i1_p2_ORF_typecomplete_len134_score8_29_NODE_1326_length_1587_cov_143_695090_g1024_i19021303